MNAGDFEERQKKHRKDAVKYCADCGVNRKYSGFSICKDCYEKQQKILAEMNLQDCKFWKSGVCQIPLCSTCIHKKDKEKNNEKI